MWWYRQTKKGKDLIVLLSVKCMCVCACVHARAFFVFLAPTCGCVWRQEVNGLRLGTFLYHPAPYFWRQGFSLIPELTDLERLVSLQVLETLRSPVVEIAGTWSYLCFSFCFCLFAGIRDLNSALYALETSTLLMSLFLLPQTLVAKKKMLTSPNAGKPASE